MTRPERGQATVETALVLPVLALGMLLLVQAGLVVRAQVLVTHAAREGARAAAVDPDTTRVRAAVTAATPLDPDRLDVVIHDESGPPPRVRVEVRYTMSAGLPLVGLLVDGLELDARATMQRELPDASPTVSGVSVPLTIHRVPQASEEDLP